MTSVKDLPLDGGDTDISRERSENSMFSGLAKLFLSFLVAGGGSRSGSLCAVRR